MFMPVLGPKGKYIFILRTDKSSNSHLDLFVPSALENVFFFSFLQLNPDIFSIFQIPNDTTNDISTSKYNTLLVDGARQSKSLVQQYGCV